MIVSHTIPIISLFLFFSFKLTDKLYLPSVIHPLLTPLPECTCAGQNRCVCIFSLKWISQPCSRFRWAAVIALITNVINYVCYLVIKTAFKLQFLCDNASNNVILMDSFLFYYPTRRSKVSVSHKITQLHLVGIRSL